MRIEGAADFSNYMTHQHQVKVANRQKKDIVIDLQDLYTVSLYHPPIKQSRLQPKQTNKNTPFPSSTTPPPLSSPTFSPMLAVTSTYSPPQSTVYYLLPPSIYHKNTYRTYWTSSWIRGGRGINRWMKVWIRMELEVMVVRKEDFHQSC